MKIEATSIPEVLLITPKVWEDSRGFFFESYNQAEMSAAGIARNWVQDNHSRSARGVLRGLHYQIIHPQAKLVRVIRGAVYDVTVDIRVGSPTFGKWHGQELSAENKKILYVPEGFAHGFYTLEDETEFVYKCSDVYYQPGERSILWNDSELGISWPMVDNELIISEKDQKAAPLSQMDHTDLPVC